MPLKPNRYWMFWGIFLAVLGLILFNFMLMPVDFKARPIAAQVTQAQTANAQVEIIDSSAKVEGINPAEAVTFTQKAACRQNIQVINTMVELWYVQHEGQWPKNDMSDIGHDIDYFPRGVPKCPLDQGQYHLDPVSHWVQGHDHGDVKNPFQNAPAFQ